MATITYYKVNASYREVNNGIIGCGVVVDTYDEALYQQGRYLNDPRIKCVDIEKVTIGH